MVHIGALWQMALFGIAVFGVGLVTLYRGAQSADAALECEDEEERQALVALGRRRRSFGLALMAVGIAVGVVPPIVFG